MRESSADNAVRDEILSSADDGANHEVSDETVSSSDDDVNHEVCGVISTVWEEGSG